MSTFNFNNLIFCWQHFFIWVPYVCFLKTLCFVTYMCSRHFIVEKWTESLSALFCSCFYITTCLYCNFLVLIESHVRILTQYITDMGRLIYYTLLLREHLLFKWCADYCHIVFHEWCCVCQCWLSTHNIFSLFLTNLKHEKHHPV